ncbi:geranylgeranylglycerol-phosphate geranylgeranyltransferase [Polaribacter sp. Z022]|uniref:geranylgeranylglycerol-phosphate geranylgeranyltransferase n=1 Tax=Polaribacter sp. Z022 TaxID=2927125 RepID=UPI002020EDE1|nr:geranylgeranylglycerol-phosphate geranylgeranyltransferase [Polaribacter sp. Z022]MCL7754905.1 geranylgeranylglycerol-phosphate geranylgeranyltransferase [Polaribacter sp. Z022]
MVLLTMVLTKYALIHSYITNSYLTHFEFFTLILSVLLITTGGYIINDIYDIETDKINKPKKVFIDVTISKKNAWRSYYLLTLLGLILGIFLSFYKSHEENSLIFAVTCIGLYLYSKHLKQKPIIGNIIVSGFIWLTIIITLDFEYVKIYDGHVFEFYINEKDTNFISVGSSVIFYSLFAFITTLIREIIKDIEDINGDLKIKAKTLPIVIGRKRASHVAFFFSSILLIFLLLVLQFIRSEYLFLGYGIIFLLLPLLYFMYKLWFAETKKDFSSLSNQMKIIMLFGILSMLLFKFI